MYSNICGLPFCIYDIKGCVHQTSSYFPPTQNSGSVLCCIYHVVYMCMCCSVLCCVCMCVCCVFVCCVCVCVLRVICVCCVCVAGEDLRGVLCPQFGQCPGHKPQFGGPKIHNAHIEGHNFFKTAGNGLEAGALPQNPLGENTALPQTT